MTTYPFPGYVDDVTALTGRIEASWGNAIRDRSIQVFDTTAHRDTAIPTPQVGQSCVITTGSTAGVRVYSGATVGWTRPWNMAWGYVGRSVSITDHVLITGEQGIDGMSVTWTALANRIYRTGIHMPRAQQITNSAELQAYITDDSNTHIDGGL